MNIITRDTNNQGLTSQSLLELRYNSEDRTRHLDLRQWLNKNGIKNEEDFHKFLTENNFKWGITGQTALTSQKYCQVWKLKDLKELIQEKTAICWDYANLEKCVFDTLGLKSNIYFLVFDNDIVNNPSHCFTIIDKGKESGLVLFEYSFRKNAGIYNTETIGQTVDMIVNWYLSEPKYGVEGKPFKVYKFDKPFPEGINAADLFKLAKELEVAYSK